MAWTPSSTRVAPKVSMSFIWEAVQTSGRVSMQRATHLCFVVSFIFFASSRDFDIFPLSAS